jgi:hypothetical protein
MPTCSMYKEVSWVEWETCQSVFTISREFQWWSQNFAVLSRVRSSLAGGFNDVCYDFSFEIWSCYSWSLVGVFWRIYENTLLLFVKLIGIQGTEWSYTLSRRSRRRRDWWTLTFPFPRSQILALLGANCLQQTPTHTHTLNMHFLEPVAATPAHASYSEIWILPPSLSHPHESVWKYRIHITATRGGKSGTM